MNYWIMKSEPGSYSIDDLAQEKRTAWEGVRNYQARNYMRDLMRTGDTVFFYHSACKEPAIVGVASVCSEAHPDVTALDRTSRYFDPRATDKNPRWYCVDVCYVHMAAQPLSLRALRADTRFARLPLLARGSRLSVMPVERTLGELLDRMV